MNRQPSIVLDYTHRGIGLRYAREKAGLTRAEVADLCGRSLASLANIEQGAVPKHSQVLADALEAIKRYERDGKAAA